MSFALAIAGVMAGSTHAAAPANTVAPVLAGTSYAGGSPAITPGTWSGSPTLTYSLEVDGVEVVAPTTQAAVEAYVYALGDEELGAVIYETPNGNVGQRVASNMVTVSLVTKILALIATGGGSCSRMLLARRESIDVTQSSHLVSAWLDKSGNGRDHVQGSGAAQPTWSGTGLGSTPALVSSDGARWLETASAFGAGTSQLRSTLVLAIDTTATQYMLTGWGSTQTDSGSLEVLVNPTGAAGTVETRARGDVGIASARSNAQTLAAAKVIGSSTDFSLSTNETIVYVSGADDTASRPSNLNNSGNFGTWKGSVFGRVGGSVLAPAGTACAAVVSVSGTKDPTMISTISSLLKTAWGV